MKNILWTICLLQGMSLSAQTVKDTLYLLNGSKIVGEIKKIKLGVVTFDPDDANVITVQLEKLRSIAALMKIFRIETTEQQVYFGKMIPSSTAGWAVIITDQDSIRIPLEKISVLYPFRDAFKQRFSGSAALGFDYTRSSKLGRLNGDATINYISKKEEVQFSLSGIYTLTDTSFSRDREDISIKYNHYFNTTWFGTVFLKTQRNLELGLLRRYQEGVGGGNKFITNRHMYAWTRCGIVINQEENTEEEKSGTLTELFSQVEFHFFRFTKPNLSLNTTEAFYYSLSQAGRVRNDMNFDLLWEMVKDFNLSFSAYWNFDSQPATTGSRKSDVGTVFSLGLSF